MTDAVSRKSIPVQIIIGVLVALAVVVVWIALSLVGIRMNNFQYIAIICVLWGGLYASIGLRSIAGALSLLIVFFGLYYVIATHGFHVAI